jgi:lipoyl(octanoyl) transferase
MWRLLVDDPAIGPADGAFNMAADEALLSAVGTGKSAPVLRLYGWQPACVSLGYAQPFSDLDQARLAALGWGVVRRLTGGRAILHADELTYSVVLPLSHPLAKGAIVESYRRLSAALLLAVKHLGLAASPAQKPDGPAANGPVCFAAPAEYEIAADGKKLIGSAQTRRFGALLQHGTLPLGGDIGRLCEVLHYPTENARQADLAFVRGRATSLATAVGAMPAWGIAADAFCQAFASTFDLAFGRDTYQPAEQAAIAALSQQRYANPAWTARLFGELQA